jgi:hypothetical protein
MESKMFKEIVSSLEKVCQEHKRVTSTLIENLDSISNGIVDILQGNDALKFAKKFICKGIRIAYVSSRLGGFWRIVLDDDDRFSVLPFSYGDVGTQQYLHGDFGSRVSYMSRDEVLYISRNIADYIKGLVEYLKNLTEDTEKELLKYANQA